MSEVLPPTPTDVLAPCPFCEQTPDLIQSAPRPGGLRHGLSIRCSNTGCVARKANLGSDTFNHASEAILVWNQLAGQLKPLAPSAKG